MYKEQKNILKVDKNNNPIKEGLNSNGNGGNKNPFYQNWTKDLIKK
jgi:hypothetical protein